MKLLTCSAVVSLAVGAPTMAALIPPHPTLFLRTNTSSGNSTAFAQYDSLANLGAGITNGQPDIDFVNHQVNDIFWDGTRYYRTYQSSGSKNKIYAWDRIEDYGDNAKATVYNMNTNWSSSDDFFCDQDGNFYRNNTVNIGSVFSPNYVSGGVTRYSSLANLLSNTGGVYTEYQTDFGLGDRFWAYGSKFYKTTTNSNGTATIRTYASLAALGSNSSEASVNTISYSTSDTFVFIPTPGSVALLAAAGLLGRRRR